MFYFVKCVQAKIGRYIPLGHKVFTCFLQVKSIGITLHNYA